MIHDLPFNCGMLSFQLLPETKSSPSQKADILINHQTKSGFNPLLRWNRVLQHSTDSSATKQIFLNDTGGPWTSASFRREYLYPCLERMKVRCDPYLQESITACFYSLHYYRRGGRTQVDKVALLRHAELPVALIKQMVYEHGWWRLRRSSLEIDVMYRQWTPRMRILLNLFFF